MKWTAIAGSWRHTNLDIEIKVRESVKSVLALGNGIVSGGALGVDFIATDEALQSGIHASKLKIIIPSTLELYLPLLRCKNNQRRLVVSAFKKLFP